VLDGQEDAVLWPVAVGEDQPLRYNIFGWGAGGASNIRNVLGVLGELGFKKVAAVVDNDRPDDVDQLSKEFPDYLIRALPAQDIRTKAAVPAKAEKLGLLDANRSVRPEFADAFNGLKSEVETFLN
jgi:hypothetical protein